MIDFSCMMEWGDTTSIYDPSKFEIIQGCVDDIPAPPELPPECWNDQAIDVKRAWRAVVDLCRGVR